METRDLAVHNESEIAERQHQGNHDARQQAEQYRARREFSPAQAEHERRYQLHQQIEFPVQQAEQGRMVAKGYRQPHE